MANRRQLSWTRVVLLLVAAAVATAATGAGCADRFVLPPVQDVRHDGAERRLFRAGTGEVEAFIARSPGAAATKPAAYVLRFTGDAAGAAKFTANRWGHRPVEVWVVNYPGYGGSTGPRTLRKLARVSLESFDELKRQAGDRPIFVEGFSLGTAPSLCVAARRPIAGLILQNPPPLKQLIVRRHGWWNLWLLAIPISLQVPTELDSVTNAPRCSPPAVFLVAEKDETIPMAFQHKIIDVYAGPKRVIDLQGAGHYAPLTEPQERALREGMDWLLSRPATPSTTPSSGG